MTKKTKVYVAVYRWRDTLNGNTYFQAKYYTEKTQGITRFQYGYGSEYKDAISKELHKERNELDFIVLADVRTTKKEIKYWAQTL